MTTAKVEYRIYIPYGWIAVEFCNVEFFGYNKNLLKNEWHDIEYKKCKDKKPIINKLKVRRDDLKKHENLIVDEIKSIQKWWKLWKSKDEKSLWNQLFIIRKKMDDIDNKIKMHEESMFYSALVLKRKAEHFLESKGFIFETTSSAGNECVTHTDVWKKG